MIKLNDEIRKYCKWQRTVNEQQKCSNKKYDSMYNEGISKDIEVIRPFLSNKNNLKLCDIGCGIGGVDILLYQNFDIERMTLIDKDGTSDKIYYGFKNEASYYNNFDLMKSFLIENDVPITNINFVNVNTDPLPSEKYDVVVSFLSLSFHYPYTTYSKFINDSLNIGGILILDVRDNTEEISQIKRDFEKYEIIKQYKKHKRIIFFK